MEFTKDEIIDLVKTALDRFASDMEIDFFDPVSFEALWADMPYHVEKVFDEMTTKKGD